MLTAPKRKMISESQLPIQYMRRACRNFGSTCERSCRMFAVG